MNFNKILHYMVQYDHNLKWNENKIFFFLKIDPVKMVFSDTKLSKNHVDYLLKNYPTFVLQSNNRRILNYLTKEQIQRLVIHNTYSVLKEYEKLNVSNAQLSYWLSLYPNHTRAKEIKDRFNL